MLLEDGIKMIHRFLCFMNGFSYAYGFGFGNGTVRLWLGCGQVTWRYSFDVIRGWN